MKNINHTGTSEKLLEKAGSYLTLMDERPLSAIEFVEFKTWLLKSNQRRLAFEQVASVWGKMDVLQGLAEIFPIDENSHTSRSSAPAYWMSAVAASIVSVGVLISVYTNFWHLAPTQEPAGKIYLTQVGQTEVINMEEGSTILANTDSQLSVLVTDTQRLVTLNKGEAFFDVEHDPERPFDVVVDDTVVRAVGTAFSVYRHGSEIEVIVTEGIVEVIHNKVSKLNLNVTPARELLHSGEVATYAENNNEVKTIEQDELTRKLTWRQGMLAFDGEPLEQMVTEFNRYNNITLEINSEEVRNIRVGGYFNSNDVEGMLTALQDNFGIQVTHITSDHVVLSASH